MPVQAAQCTFIAEAEFFISAFAVQEARFGVSADVDFLIAESQNHVVSAILDAEADLGSSLAAYIGLPASVEMLMEMDGASSSEPFPSYIAQPDDTAAAANFLAEVEGNPHDSLVFAYMQDAGSARPARLLQQAVEGQPASSERLFWFVALDNAYTLYAGYGETEVAATADATFLLKKKSEGVTTTVATMVFQAGEETPVITITDSVLSVGDRLSFHAPASQDDTLADMLVAFVLLFA